MAIRIKVRHGETINQMLRRFKKLCEKEGLTKEVKRRQYYEKPSERARRDARRSFVRTTSPRPPRAPRSGPGGGFGGGSGGGSGGSGGERRERRPSPAGSR
jgi:small subunit ribosomal protein S21